MSETKTALVTGATDGLGRAVADALARAGCRVLLHGRDADKGAAVLAEVRRDTGNHRVEFLRADFADLAQVRDLARAIDADGGRLDILVNNAGGSSPERRESRDGYELTLAVNALAPFLLTQLLLPTLKRSVPARIVNVASMGQAPVDFDDLQLQRSYDGLDAYRRSKLAEIAWTLELAEQLAGSGVTAVALHPGRTLDTPRIRARGITPLTPLQDGVDAVVRLALAPEVEGETGVYYDQQRVGRALDQAYDPLARRRLWEAFLRLAGL